MNNSLKNVRVKIQHLSHKGKGCATIDNRAVEVSGVLPGDVVDVVVVSKRRHTARVRLERIVEEGIDRIDAECCQYGRCGGCVWQNVPYQEQCRLKKELVETALGSIPGGYHFGETDIVPSPDQFFYRNKMEFSFDSPPKEDRIIRLGLHEAGRYDRVFDLKQCLLQSELSNRVVQATGDYVRNNELSVYGLKSHKGLLRYLMIRDGKNTGDLMVNLVTSGDDFPQLEQYAGYVRAEIPEITTILRSINSGRASVTVGEEHETVLGDGVITDRIGQFLFTISPDSFFQTNTSQAYNLYETIRSYCNLDGTQRLLDLYSGTGTIGIYCSDGAASVTGVELVESAVYDARRNAELNEVSNCTFISGTVEKFLGEDLDDFDVVICDPPRAGIHPKAMHRLLQMRVPRMVYISCNIKALPADLEMLFMAGYRIRKVMVFDMSPHTPHVETVVLLEIL